VKLFGRAGLFACALALSSCGGNAREEQRASQRVMQEIVLDQAPAETGQEGLFGRSAPPLRTVIRAVDAARTDRQVTGLFLRLGGFGSAWGRHRDLAEAIAALREAGKPVHCYMETNDNVGYAFAARSCDRISITPAGMLDTVGVSAQLFFARRMLDSIGVRADVLQVGRFKGAAEPLVRDSMSPELRESIGALVDDLHADVLDAMITGRRLDAQRAQAILDEGPYDSARALEVGLVDDVAFDDEARTHARRAARADRVDRVQLEEAREPLDLDSILRALSGETEEEEANGQRLALVHLEGNIVDAEESGPGSGRSGPFVREMRRLAEDDSVRAVVLRIDSPGGSALASDRMWHAVHRCAAKKPVIVSVGDMAASGGYYIAAAGTLIFAHPTSTVGSIGVIGGKVDLSQLMDEIGVSAEIIARGQNAAWSTPTRGFTDRERAVLVRSMRSTYRRFLRRVAEGRDMEIARVEEIAEGRVWSGRRGLELGLVDRLGGLSAAIELARERGELEDDAPIEEWPRDRSFLQMLAELVGGPSASAASMLRDAVRFAGLPVDRAIDLAESLAGREHVVLALPIVLELR
jgi:protease IV